MQTSEIFSAVFFHVVFGPLLSLHPLLHTIHRSVSFCNVQQNTHLKSKINEKLIDVMDDDVAAAAVT